MDFIYLSKGLWPGTINSNGTTTKSAALKWVSTEDNEPENESQLFFVDISRLLGAAAADRGQQSRHGDEKAEASGWRWLVPARVGEELVIINI